MDEECARIWQKLSLALKPEVSADTFKRWFSAVELIQADDESLTFRVPNNIYQFWIESNNMTALQSAIVAALGAPREIKFSASSTGGSVSVETAGLMGEGKEAAAESTQEGKPNASAAGLNPRNTFETFVVGPNNEIAHAASLAVAQSPARTYNPLFIYGGVGLGK